MEDKTILVVDDTVSNLDIMVSFLKEYDVIDTIDGEEALEIANEQKIDLILLDIIMPFMDGYEVCKKLKDNPQTRDIPVIFITAQTDEESIDRAYKMGGIDYITKPFRFQEVLFKVKKELS